MHRAAFAPAVLPAVGAIVCLAIGDLGDVVFGPVDVESQTGENGNLGVQFLNGQYFVSTRGSSRTPHRVHVFSAAGVLTGCFDEHWAAQPSNWGYRDGATDGDFLYFGCELGVFRHEGDGSNATRIIGGGGPYGNYRALAYDPSGDGGNGSLWSCTFESPIIEISMTGDVLTTFPNLDGWSLYGLALDPVTGNLWGHHGIRPVGGHPPPEIREIDTTTGRTTGVSWPSDAGVPGTPGGFPVNGGLTLVPGGAGGSGHGSDLVALLQADIDVIVGFELHPAASCPADVNGDGVVSVSDLLAVLVAWGNTGGPEDINGDGIVSVPDLLTVLAGWGPCP